MRVFGGALFGLFVIGAGLALLQTAANPYISIVGPIESAAQRIAVMGICNKAAGILAPIVFGLLVMRGATQAFWRHQVPKTARPVGERINLTFRRVTL